MSRACLSRWGTGSEVAIRRQHGGRHTVEAVSRAIESYEDAGGGRQSPRYIAAQTLQSFQECQPVDVCPAACLRPSLEPGQSMMRGGQWQSFR